MVQRYNECDLQQGRSRRSVLMKFRSIFLSSIVAGLILSASAFAQDDKQKPQTPSTQTQPADQTQAPAADPGQHQAQQPAENDKSQPAAADQTQSQPAADQDQPATDQDTAS